MIARIFNPMVTGLLGVLLSVAIGIGLCWNTLNSLVERTVVLRAEEAPKNLTRKGWDFWTVEISNLSNELQEDRAELKKRAEQLDQREARIGSEEMELAKARADIEAMQKQISDRVNQISADEATNLRKLAQTYSNLSPEAVVAIIRQMDDNTAVKILSLMKPDVVGPIFEQMSKTAGADGTEAKRAAALSDKLRLVSSAKRGAAQ